MAPWTIGKILSPARLRRLVPALALVLCAGAGARGQAEPQLLSPGTQAPDFTADANGSSLTLSSQRGKVVVLDFWATWCPPCQRSLPHLQEVARKVAGQKVAFLGICVWDKREAFNAWMDKNPPSSAVKFAYDPAGRSPENIASSKYRVNGIPTTYIISPQGKVVETIIGFTPGDTSLEAALRKQGIKLP
jgi:thiol-disulfide isomerase/thioredoxin